MYTSKSKALTDMLATMDRQQAEWRGKHIMDSIPYGWNGMDSFDGVKPHKTRVTIRLDADMVRWFRKLGPNYSQRMNDVLRIYWTALLCGQITAYIGDDPMARMQKDMDDLRARLRAQNEALGC